MDDLEFQDEILFQTLRELDFINKWLGGNVVSLNAVKKVWASFPKTQELSIVDLGCGSGEMLRLIARCAKKENRKVLLKGIDANPNVVRYGRSILSNSENLQFETLNIKSGEFQKQNFDIIIATLFFHHFTDEELVNLLFSLKKQTKVALVVNDINRHPLAYYSIKWLTSLFSRSSMVKYDAPLSVLRGFKAGEFRSILEKAGIRSYSLKWRWAFRWQLIVPFE
jgi:2-polyprenyl-3-methyl-5-hydroxy-6-metoxy-1,4-benzoquinol methylase